MRDFIFVNILKFFEKSFAGIKINRTFAFTITN